MLFTKSTESGIQLENAMILTPELFKKTQIPANTTRLLEWARDNHVSVGFFANDKSDFNCRIGIMMDSEVSDNTMNATKKMLKHLGDELVKFIDDMPKELEEAKKVAEDCKRLDIVVSDFKAAVKAICGEDTIVRVEIFKLREIDADELAHMLKTAINKADGEQ